MGIKNDTKLLNCVALYELFFSHTTTQKNTEKIRETPCIYTLVTNPHNNKWGHTPLHPNTNKPRATTNQL